MESICPICKKPYDGVVCSQCTVTDLDVSGLMASEGLQVESDNPDDAATAFLVDLVSNRKIPITTPRCKVGRDDLNDIVISGDQSISRFHFVITKENNQYFVQDGKSRHGTFLNGNQITAPEPIHDGDVLKVGVSLFWFVIETASTSSEADRSAPVDLEVMDQQELEFMVPEPISSGAPIGNGKQEAASTKASELETSPRVQPLKNKKADSSETGKKEKAELAKKQAEPVDESVPGSEKETVTASHGTDSPTLPPGQLNAVIDSISGKTDGAKPKDTEGESFLVDSDDNSIQSSLLNSISESLRAERKSEAIIGADEEFSMGAFTFFEPLTEVPKDEEAAEPVKAEDHAGDKAEDQAGNKAGDQPGDKAGDHAGDKAEDQPGDKAEDQAGDKAEDQAGDKAEDQAGDKANRSDILSAKSVEIEPVKDKSEVEPVVDQSQSKLEFEPKDDLQSEFAAEPVTSSQAKSETEPPNNAQSKSIAELADILQSKTEADPLDRSQNKSKAASNSPQSGKEDETVVSSATTQFEPTSSVAPEAAKVTNELKEALSAKTSETERADISEKEEESSSTLDKFAEIVGEANPRAAKKTNEDVIALSKVLSEFQPAKSTEPAETKEESTAEQKPLISDKQPSSNGAKSAMTIVKEPTGQVPDWCKRYFSDELNNLSNELTDLNEQVRAAQQKIKDVEGRVALTKGLRNTLLTAQGEELVEACGKVLTLLGWRVKVSDDDKHELRLDTEDKNICIARIVWTETQADRTHLGQLSISQTRYWCEQGIEPKGILIISKSNDSGPSTLGSSDFNSELAEYATKKNVCLMSTLQLLAVYKDIALHNGLAEEVRATILASNGWLSGFALEPGDIAEKEEPTNKLSSLLSA
jgi:pSer/pThr/pTyr-binding forkhead associated (FHA) protein